MKKSLFEIMEASDDSTIDFEKACYDLIHTRYILADKKISGLLQQIAKNKNLYALIANCMQDFDFKSVFNQAKAAGGDGRALVLPTECKKIIAFVFCLLLSFDTNQTDFKKFLHTFYHSVEGPNAEFEKFAHHVIVPFCASVFKAYFQEAETPASEYAQPAPASAPLVTNSLVPTQHTTQEHQISPTTLPQEYATTTDYGTIANVTQDITEPYLQDAATYIDTSLDALAIQSLGICAREIIGIVSRDSTLAMVDREELLLVCEAFEQAISLAAAKPIRTMYIALKYTVRCSPLVRQLEIQCDDLERLMQEYGLD